MNLVVQNHGSMLHLQLKRRRQRRIIASLRRMGTLPHGIAEWQLTSSISLGMDPMTLSPDLNMSLSLCWLAHPASSSLTIVKAMPCNVWIRLVFLTVPSQDNQSSHPERSPTVTPSNINVTQMLHIIAERESRWKLGFLMDHHARAISIGPTARMDRHLTSRPNLQYIKVRLAKLISLPPSLPPSRRSPTCADAQAPPLPARLLSLLPPSPPPLFPRNRHTPTTTPQPSPARYKRRPARLRRTPNPARRLAHPDPLLPKPRVQERRHRRLEPLQRAFRASVRRAPSKQWGCAGRYEEYLQVQREVCCAGWRT